MIENGRRIFNEYVKPFVLENSFVLGKYHHTYRVTNYALAIANSLNLNNEECEMVYLCALFHDIGRFKQYIQYKTYNDLKSVNHGKLGYDILKEQLIDKIVNDKDKQEIILFAVLNHNKRLISKGTDKQNLYTKIIRDADKMDIMKEQSTIIKELCPKINYKLVNYLYKNKSCDDKDIKNSTDFVLRQLGFIYDINFKYTCNFIIREKIIENKINLLEVNTNENLIKLEKHLLNYLRGVIKC